MALKIKEGAIISAYGGGCHSFTSESELSQEVLEHLQSQYPDDIEDSEPKAPKVPKAPAAPKAPKIAKAPKVEAPVKVEAPKKEEAPKVDNPEV